MRYKMIISYDGTSYAGYQKQKNKQTIQTVLESVLASINSNNIVHVVSSGRTDAGVHAINQVVHFDLIGDIPISRLTHSLNKMLPSSIYVKNIEKVNNQFHARFSTKGKKYLYKINMGEYCPHDVNYIYQYNQKLNITKMAEAIKYFKGSHDFSAYTKTADRRVSYERTIYDASIIVHNDIVEITFIGNGFLRYMVRNMVGSLIEVGNGKIDPAAIDIQLKSCDRKQVGVNAPPNGLYLVDVYYSELE